MISVKNRMTALAMVGLTLYGSLFVTAAFAAPQKKKHTKKPPIKKDDKKATAALLAAGKKVYETAGCAGCHSIGGAGGNAGPDLSKVAAEKEHTASWLEAHVKNPKTHSPDSTMPSYEDKIKGKDLKALGTYLASLK